MVRTPFLPFPTSRRLVDYPQVDMPGVRYKSVISSPQGYTEESFAHVARTLASVWGNLTTRDPSELLAALSVTAGTSTSLSVYSLTDFISHNELIEWF